MALISYETTFTLHIGSPQNNEYMKVTIGVKDIDTSLDVAEQIQASHLALHETMQWADAQMLTKVNEALSK